ncbi:MAG: argininosuccinate lyase [Candidatus Raymondbacteria bacterium RifOxyC12_full_50_8]|uniref:Argininosuccinate lyase n=1 Tax=Candidatus Raymondbacteria bacterium RIFOXYD12_FULL_49_13 TaxID=1817890 RepID=A0A1F7F6T2_UNCRA|nr:MAG: argininosuccinate lyase [Candidatus Raymondbacteria bacterium RifOxyB12_full_50_8]OGJ93196.1 MAG: argininosuccinate lyase [Candidatus Raymondbacteria bacterium RIFOXYA2_FULL_49_16]OGJ94647.1 MAG: argininosuccinate lyase [Candidatus Raymondbacteria bacterium RifOxyC12_full_50_8]OGK02303.1 MAG: argininosuccinate lyase [Candidatus Raymondbacteria bacterium RIFOXYD12_FULL_49_13]OGP44918.1 MAG: argininosuccinate lyase [Candidatus Raymondbacteria bacterium RIFOXYB2_FULL_49_35]
MKMWEGRFSQKNAPAMERFNRSLGFDKRLIAEDIAGSVAYARALAKAGLLSKNEAAAIVRGLDKMRSHPAALRFTAADEDIHMAIERILSERIGTPGKKLHTGRSRNSQIALDTRLYLKKEIYSLDAALRTLMRAVLTRAEKTTTVIMPAFTHLQKAQPVLMAHYFLSWFFMLERDLRRFSQCLVTVDVLPLGSGALAGSAYPIDRAFLARALGFSAMSDNSIDAVSDRDYMLEFMSCAAITAMHLSRFAEDLVIFSSPGYGFFELADAYATGSSMMPNKKNPDSLELVRGKTGRVYGNLVTLLTVMKGLPLTYNKDMQEDKEPLFDTIDTLDGCLEIFTGVLDTLTVNPERVAAMLSADLLATDLADALTKNKTPFREAHAIVGRIVRDCAQKGVPLETLTHADLRKYSPRVPGTFSFCYHTSIAARSLPGGTGSSSVRAQICKARTILKRKTYDI